MGIGQRLSAFGVDAAAQVRLALPILGAQLAMAGMGTVDTLMVGRYGAADLAAVAVGSSLWMPLLLLLAGVLMALSPHVARLRALGQTAALGGHVHSVLWLGGIAGVLAGLGLLAATPGLAWTGTQPATVAAAGAYLAGVAAGLPAIGLFQAARSLCEGMHDTRPIFLVSLLALAVNVPANYLLIHGGAGLPALGATGCGIATGLSMWAMAAALLAYVGAAGAYRRMGIFAGRRLPQLAPIGHTLRLGLPIGLSLFFEVTLFAAVTLLVAGLGTSVVAAHQIALNVATLLFMLPLSLGIALTVRVGYARGSSAESARRCARHGLALGLLLGLGLGAVMAIFAAPVAGLYSADPAVRSLAASLLLLAALFQVSDTLQVTAAGALRGYEDTRSIMLITLPSYWLVGLGCGVWLGISGLPPGPLGVHGFWLGLLAGLSVAALLLTWRLTRIWGRLTAV